MRPINRVALLQGAYYILIALWALIDIRSFESVTGPKTDLWLVRTVAVLVLVIGASLVAAGVRRRITPETILLALGCALGLAGIEGAYVAKGRLSAVYGADAILELIFAWAWVSWTRPRRRSRVHDAVPRVLYH